MSYNPMMGGLSSSHGRGGSYIPDYESSSYKMPPQNFNQFTSPQLYPQQNSSIALFHVPNDATNSLYVDGVPNDTNEREVSRTCLVSQIYSVPSQVSNASV